MQALQRQVDAAETATREERAAHDVTKQQLDEINMQVLALRTCISALLYIRNLYGNDCNRYVFNIIRHNVPY